MVLNNNDDDDNNATIGEVVADTLINAVRGTHPIQLVVLLVALLVDVFGLVLINQHKQRQPWLLQKKKKEDDNNPRASSESSSWESKRNIYLVLLLVHVVGNSVLDAHYKIDTAVLIHVKNFATAFWIGLLDYFYSNTHRISYRVLGGAVLWCFCTLMLPRVVVDTLHLRWYGTVAPSMHIAREWTAHELSCHLGRFLAGMLSVGMLADLIFSPMHRLMHDCSPALYRANHRVHHQYTSNITSLVLYHGTALDDFLMPSTVTIGFLLWWCLTHRYYNPFSNVYNYLTVPATIFSHSHDVRCARLMMPGIPDSLNFVAYHHQHHLHPNKNYGLTKPSDLIWDYILGVDTIVS